MPYHSSHKFRHGHAVYTIKNAKDIPALKAVSQNLMHANLSITDGVYGMLSDLDVKGEIEKLGRSVLVGQPGAVEELKILLELVSQQLGEGLIHRGLNLK